MLIILDACSLINLIHIEDDESFFNRVVKLEPKLSIVVFREVCKNVYNVYNIFDSKGKISPYDKELIERKISYLRPRIVEDSYIEFICPQMHEKIEQFTKYSKRNGEYYSISLATFLCRMENSKVIFVTDDKPAKAYFQEFFIDNQIGYIEDTVDLLVFLFTLYPDIKIRQIDSILSNLYSQYALVSKNFFNSLNELRSNLPREWTRDYYVKEKISKCIYLIDKYNFNELKKEYEDLKPKKKYSTLTQVFKKHESIFEIGVKPEKDLLTKIIETRNRIKTPGLFRLSYSSKLAINCSIPKLSKKSGSVKNFV